MSDFQFQTVPTLQKEIKLPVEQGAGIDFPKTIPKLVKVEKAKPTGGGVNGLLVPQPSAPLSGPDFGFSVTAEEATEPPPAQPAKPVNPEKEPYNRRWPFPRSGSDLRIGDIVRLKNREELHAGNDSWPHVMVVSIAPFVLVSPDAEMRWEKNVDSEEFESAGIATTAAMMKCLTRLKM
jgi:hypothetical protein